MPDTRAAPRWPHHRRRHRQHQPAARELERPSDHAAHQPNSNHAARTASRAERAAVHRPEQPHGVAVDIGGNLYVADTWNNRVVKLAGGSPAQDELPFTGLNGPQGGRWTALVMSYVVEHKQRAGAETARHGTGAGIRNTRRRHRIASLG
jgi:hypothetical protein